MSSSIVDKFSSINHLEHLAPAFKGLSDTEFLRLKVNDIERYVDGEEYEQSDKVLCESEFSKFIQNYYRSAENKKANKQRIINKRRRTEESIKVDETIEEERGEQVKEITEDLSHQLQKSLSLKDTTDATDPPLKRKRVEKICDFITSKRIQYTKTLDELVKLDLEKLLLQTLLGLSILRGNEMHSMLKSAEKISLVEVLIDWVLIRCKNPGYEIYKLLQKKIKTLFPNEDEEIYYVSPKDHNKKKTVIRGELYNRVKNRREWMIQKGLLNEEETVQYELAEAEKSTYMTDEILASINWLKIYKEKSKELAKHWLISAPYRQEFLRNQSDNKITSYTEKFNVLKKTFGYKLIDIDFEYLFPQNKDTLANNWESFCRKLTELIDHKDFTEKEAKVYKIALQNCLKEEDNPTSENAKNLLMMKRLPTLLPATHKVRLEGKLQKPSAKHCREELFLHAETYNDIRTERKNRRDIAAKEGISVEPYISYVGKNAVTVDAVYVCIDDFMYKSENFLQALSTCFKAFFALNLEYPPRTKYFWCFLERVIFKMKESQDYMPNVIALEGEFRVLS